MSVVNRQRFLRMNAINFMGQRFERLGNTFLQGEYLHTRDPTLAHRVLVSEADRTCRVDNPLSPLLGETMTLLDGERWLGRRKLLLPAFRAALQAHPAVVRPLVAEAVEAWRGVELDLYRALRALMLRITARSLLGWSPSEEVVEELIHYLERVTVLGSLLRTTETHGESWAEVRTGFERLVDVEGCGSPLLAAMRGAREAGEMTAEEVRQEVWGLLLAGQDTVVLSLLLALWFCSGGSEDLTDAEARGRHIQEVLRLYPPAYAVPRLVVRPLEPAAEGQQVIVWSYFIHRSEQLYDAPLAFRPGRWSGEKPPPGGYLPFGLGGHRCLGEKVALSTLDVALEVLYPHVGRLQWRIDEIPPLMPYVSLTPAEPTPVSWSDE